MPAIGDWLAPTADDALLAPGDNPGGALSHNFVDITGAGGPGFNLAPSLTGALTLEMTPSADGSWTVKVVALTYAGQANVAQAMNQFLVTPEHPAASEPSFRVDGLGNSGRWNPGARGKWAIEYLLDFHLATNADGDPSPGDIDATFDDQEQTGFLIPRSQLTMEGLANIDLDDPLRFHAGDFREYLLREIAPRLPNSATYLLITQMRKGNPAHAEMGLPITTNSLLGNTTIAYSTSTLVAAPRIRSIKRDENKITLRFDGLPGVDYQIQWSADFETWEVVDQPQFSFPEPEFVDWVDSNPGEGRRFYRVAVPQP
jgi:hypothetical protein